MAYLNRKNNISRIVRKLVFPGILLYAGIVFWLISHPGKAVGGTYTSSAHGNSSSGVDRSVVTGAPYPDAAQPYAVGHCGHCHEQHASVDGLEPTPPVAEGESLFSLFRSNYGSGKNELCYACHELLTFVPNPIGYGRYGVYQGKTNYVDSTHNTSGNMIWPPATPPGPAYSDAGNCHNCHNPHGYDDGGGLLPSMLFIREENLCYECHDVDGPSSNDIESLITLKTSRHNVASWGGIHISGITAGREDRTFISNSANKHVECVDCHNAHQSSDTNPTRGAPGADPSNPGNWVAPSTYTVKYVAGGVDEFMICFRCHSGYNQDLAGWSLNTWTDQGLEFNTSNSSYHWVEGDRGASKMDPNYGNFNLTLAEEMMPRFKNLGYTHSDYRSVQMRCSDCHGPDGFVANSTPNGPHGSSTLNLPIIKVPSGSTYNVWSSSSAVGDTNIWCFNCHDPNFASSGFSNSTDGNLHLTTNVHNGRLCMNCHVKIPHGYYRPRLVLDPTETDTNYKGTAGHSNVSTWKSSGQWTQGDCNSTGTHEGACI